jgi:L-2-hydroxyglutarate oxidase
MPIHDFAIIGGGIVGLATAMTLARREPAARLLVLEKEVRWGAHQTGHNSGVIHSGIYYQPGSLKAQLSREGNRSLVRFCVEHGLRHEVCGKVIVATNEEELPLLEALYRRGLENGLCLAKLRPEEVREIEPHVRCLEAIRVPSTGIVSYAEVCEKLAWLLAAQGAELRLGTALTGIRPVAGGQVLETNRGGFEARFLINCAGLHSDRVARLGGIDPGAIIVPFRGEYYELKPEKRHLVKWLVYPVPNPAFPFLGVHFTRLIDGGVHAGPNAVLSFKREGYARTDFELGDFAEVMTFPGFWRLVASHPKEGLAEMVRSFSKTAFVRSLQRLIPEVRSEDLVPTQAGVRAQALKRDGRLVDDFLMLKGRNAIHVCNAPSPAATAAFEIARLIAEQVPTCRELPSGAAYAH